VKRIVLQVVVRALQFPFEDNIVILFLDTIEASVVQLLKLFTRSEKYFSRNSTNLKLLFTHSV